MYRRSLNTFGNMAQFDLAILCVGLWLIGNSASQTSSLSVNKTEIDCTLFKCPHILKCPADSSLALSDDLFNEELPFQPLPLLHYRSKRDIEPKYLEMVQQCCTKHQCNCNTCPPKPACKTGQVLVELSPGDGKPGSCCPQYECGEEPKCVDGVGATYWQDGCIKCNSCRLPCTDECWESLPPINCLSDDDGEIKFHGDSWLQANDCVECTCNNGHKQCFEPTCIKPECDNYKKVPGECCPICLDAVEQPPLMIAIDSTTAPTTAAAAAETTTTTTAAAETTIAPATTPTTTAAAAAAAANETTTVAATTPTTTSATETTTAATTETTTAATTTASRVTTEGAFVQSSSSTVAEISSESSENSTERVQLIDQQQEQEQSLDDTSTPSASSELPEDFTEGTPVQGDSTDFTSQELDSFESATSLTELADAIAVDIKPSTTTDMNNLISSSSSGSTTEQPKLLATSAPAALTPESTSWHRDSTIDDADYRFANETQTDASNQKYKFWLYVIIGITGLPAIILFISLVIKWSRKPRKQRKSHYLSVPNSDSNLSDHTNISDVGTSTGHHSETETA